MAPHARPILAMVLVCTFSLVVFFAAQEDATGSVLESSNYHSEMVYSQVSNAIDQGDNVNVKGVISSVAPQRGPSSGGTLLTIMGRDFTTGDENDVTRVLLHGVPARVKEVREGFMVVQAAPLDLEKHSPGRGSVKVYSRHMGLTSFKHGFHYLPPMAVLEVTPDNGPHKGGTTVTITGRNLCSASGSPTSVHLAGQEAKFLSCHHGGGSLVVRTAPLAASARGRVGALELMHEELGNVKVAKAFRYNTAPMVSRISPIDGPAQGGNRVRLQGAMLTAGREEPRERVTVDVGGKPARVLEYNPNSVLVEMPPGEGGKRVEVTVNSALQGSGVSRQTYHYLHAPRITTLEPPHGAAQGGTKLIIRGHHLGHGDITMVTIGETRARVLSAARDGRKVIVLTEKFSEDEAGESLPVEMDSTSHGKVVTEDSQSFKVARAPRIITVTPHGGPLQGNTLVTIRGADLCDDVTMVATPIPTIEDPEATEEDKEEDEEEGDVVSRLWQKTEDQVKLEPRCVPGDISAVHLAGTTAELVEASPKQIIVRTAKGVEAHRGGVHVVSLSAGEAHSPHAVAFEYHSPPQIRKLSPATGSPTGGEVITLHGSQLCSDDCEDLHRLRIGDSLVTEFISKSPETVTFKLPEGLPGWSTVVAESVLYGRAVAPSSFLYQQKQVGKFTATPTDVPLTGGTFVEIHGENLLHAKHTSGALTYTVLLAGVPAKVLSASSTKILTQAGDAAAHCAKLGSACHHGLSGTIMIHQDGTSTAFDTAIPFKYNAPCAIHRLETPKGDTSGTQLTLFGRYLGLGDEEVRVNGQLVTVTARHRRVGAMVTRLSLALPDPMGNDTPHVQISSKRGGMCSWPLAKAPHTAPHSNGAAVPPAGKPAHTPLKLGSVQAELAAMAHPQPQDTPAQQQAYTMFLEEVKQGWQSAVGDAPVDEHAKRYWDAMSAEDKKIYQARAEALIATPQAAAAPREQVPRAAPVAKQATPVWREPKPEPKQPAVDWGDDDDDELVVVEDDSAVPADVAALAASDMDMSEEERALLG